MHGQQNIKKKLLSTLLSLNLVREQIQIVLLITCIKIIKIRRMEHPGKQNRLEIGSVFWYQLKHRAQRSQRFWLATIFNKTTGCIITSHQPNYHKH